MKKLFVVLSLLAVLAFGAVPSQALVGMPDNVPGRDILVPFFYVSMPGFGNENTLVTITDVLGLTAPTGYPELHLVIYDIKSVPQFNINIEHTKFDVVVTDAYTLINLMSPVGKKALEIDTDGNGVNDHWAGYIFVENLYTDLNNLISQCYQVYLTAGMAAGFNGVKIEYNAALAAGARQGVKYFPGDTGWSEAFSPDALFVGNGLLTTGAVPAGDPNWFRLLPRYFVMDAVGKSLLIIWKSANTLVGTPLAPFPIHCNFYDEKETVLSADIYLPFELNIINITTILPYGLFSGYPWGGWIDIFMPDPYGNGPKHVSQGGFDKTIQWLGYSWQRAIGPAAEAWEVMHEVDRDTGYKSPLYPR